MNKRGEADKLRYVQVRVDDHNDLSDALGVEHGTLGWHELIKRVEKLRAIADSAQVYRREYGYRGPMVEAAVIDRLFSALDAVRSPAAP